MKNDFKILLGEPNHYHAVLISRQVAERYPDSRVDLFTCMESVIRASSGTPYDVAIVDPNLNGPERMDILQLLHQADIDLPVIIVTASGSEREAAEAIRAGAAEYILKENAYYQVIPRVVSEVIRRKMLIRKNRQLEEKLQKVEQKELVRIAASTLSHEVNNPLQTIMGTSELLLDEDEISEKNLVDKIKIIRESAERIQRTLQRLTNLATPAIKETVSGQMIDPELSRTYTRRTVPKIRLTE